MRIAISGATGLVGSALATTLSARGDAVLRLVRRPTSHPDEIYYDPASGSLDAKKCHRLDALVHLAGKPLDEERWSPAVKAALHASRVPPTRFLAEAVAAMPQPPAVFVSASAIGYYAFSDVPISETTGRPGTDFLATLCEDWEQAARPAERATRLVFLRTAPVLAARGHSFLARLLPFYRAGLGAVAGRPAARLDFIGLEDAVAAIVHALDSSLLHGPVNLVAPHATTQAEFARTLSRLLGKSARLRIPAPILRLMMGEMANLLFRGDPNLVPEVLLRTGFAFTGPTLTDALRHELAK